MSAAKAPQPPEALSDARAGWLEPWLRRVWQSRGPAAWLLWPVSLLYRLLIAIRQSLYRQGVLRSEHPGRPVVVVGNVIAGGAGKTPVVIALARHLQARGLRPGVISRGYGRQSRDCIEASGNSTAPDVGDEPALIARQCPGVPVFVAPRRVDAARALLAAHPYVDVILCDDGLQHLALQRDIEICVFNVEGVGNGFMLPAGPLRQPWPCPVDFVLHAATAAPVGTKAPAFAIRRRLAAWAVRSDGQQVALHTLRGQPVHALAAVARPEAFFGMLRAEGLLVEQAESLPDHYDFHSWKRPPDKHLPIVCTEKDAVKLWRNHPEALAVPLVLDIGDGFLAALDQRLDRLNMR